MGLSISACKLIFLTHYYTQSQGLGDPAKTLSIYRPFILDIAMPHAQTFGNPDLQEADSVARCQDSPRAFVL